MIIIIIETNITVCWSRTVGETNLYDKEIMPSSLTSFSGHTRSRLHEKHQVSSICACPLTSINSKCESVTAGGIARSLAVAYVLPNLYPTFTHQMKAESLPYTILM